MQPSSSFVLSFRRLQLSSHALRSFSRLGHAQVDHRLHIESSIEFRRRLHIDVSSRRIFNRDQFRARSPRLGIRSARHNRHDPIYSTTTRRFSPEGKGALAPCVARDSSDVFVGLCCRVSKERSGDGTG